MKRVLGIMLSLIVVLSMTACSGGSEWTRTGFFDNEGGSVLVLYEGAENEDDSGGILVAFFPAYQDDYYTGSIVRDGRKFRSTLAPNFDAQGESLEVTLKEEGEDGVMLQVEGGETYHLVFFMEAEDVSFLPSEE